ncbi:MAG: hypothetical protein ACJARW_001367 [Methylophilaceae bacterium]|jgi:uncharacterized protein YcfJ|tara:strand:- start:38192 stop:38809 length:618 start_codon:yes stop_codon:yes gene_type:complete
MFSKKSSQTLLVGLVFTGVSMAASAGHDAYEDRGRVISVTPQVERVNVPVQECRTEYVRESYYENNQRSSGGSIIGAIAGGVIGSRFGGGNGRLIATAVGAGLGAVIGDRHSNSNNKPRQRIETRPVERCASVDRWETVDRGYLVDYEYNGRRYTTKTLDRPDKFITVDVSVQPRGYIDDIDYQYNNRGKKHYRKHEGGSYRRHF